MPRDLLPNEVPDPAFDSAWLKVDRARELLTQLRQEEAAYLAANPVDMEVRVEARGDGSEIHRVVAHVHQGPPVSWVPLVGDIVHNARSALDHAVWASASPALRGRHTQFPIYDRKRDWDERAARALAGVSDRQRDLVREFQPFLASDGRPELVPLAILRDLSNRDKHQALHAIALISNDEMVGTTNADITFEHLARVYPILDGGEAMRILARPENPRVAMVVSPRARYQTAIERTFGGMVDTLDGCCWFVERVLGRLEHPARSW